MNHDAWHCLDYDKSKCPADCYWAKLTQELSEWVYMGIAPPFISWCHFNDTEYCKSVRGVIE